LADVKPFAASLALLAAMTVAPRAKAQLPQGGETPVNTYTSGNQAIPAIATDSSGNFIVVWISKDQEGTGSGYGIYAQRYASSGSAAGPEFRVNTYTTNGQGNASVAFDGAGAFVVVWQSLNQDGSSYGILGQRFASSGAPLGGEFVVNSYTSGLQYGPSVFARGNGDFVAVWTSKGQDGANYGVFGQRWASSGARIGAEFRVNTFTTQNQSVARVAGTSAGDFVVVWQGYQQDGDSAGIFGQRYASDGSVLGTEFQVNALTTDFQGFPKVSFDGKGAFVVVWASTTQTGAAADVFGQRYTSAGVRAGTQFQINTYALDFQIQPDIASDSVGNFVVVWSSFSQDGDSYGIFGQLYASSGGRVGSEFRVNTFTTNRQIDPSVSSDSTGHFVVAWQSNLQDFSGYGIYAQRLCSNILSVTVTTTGSLAVCPTGTGGTATVTDSGGGVTSHQWVYKTSPMGAPNLIAGQTATSYLISGPDFAGGATGIYYLGCLTSSLSCGPQMFSNDVIVTVSNDTTPPSVTAPSAATATQTLCQ